MRLSISAYVLIGLCIFAGRVVASSDGSVDESTTDVGGLLRIYADHRGSYLPELSGDELDGLRNGDAIVRVVDDTEVSPSVEQIGLAVVGLKIVDAPQLLIWLALVNDSEELDGRFARAVLSEGGSGSVVRYQHINLPWPIKDRHWIIHCENNLDVVDLSSGVIWERRWSLHDQGQTMAESAYSKGEITGLTQRTLEKSIYLVSNRGAWTLFRMGPNTTLVTALVDVQLGGSIPDMLVRGFGKRQLRSALIALQDMSAAAASHYDPSVPVYNGRGNLATASDIADAVQSWDQLRSLKTP